MLSLNSCTAPPIEVHGDTSTTALAPGVVWIDLNNATAEEVAFVEKSTGLHVPTRADLSEIESSSRLSTKNGALYLSTPVVTRSEFGYPVTTPLGLVLTPERMITVRFAPLPVLEAFKARMAAPDAVHPSSAGAFVGLIEALIDRMADVLEEVGTHLDTLSHRIFRREPTKVRRPKSEDEDLREVLRSIGRDGDLASKIRDSLLGIGRIVPYVAGLAGDRMAAEVKLHLATIRDDIASLSDYDTHLANKVQLLLDATLGLINIEQNNIIKVLTIVSVVGVPPTLVASMYGMNFHDMPELSWAWGYPYGLALIFVSAVGPLLWFKLRGWL